MQYRILGNNRIRVLEPGSSRIDGGAAPQPLLGRVLDRGK